MNFKDKSHGWLLNYLDQINKEIDELLLKKKNINPYVDLVEWNCTNARLSFLYGKQEAFFQALC